MLDAIKTMLVNTPILNVLFLVLCNGIYVRHIIKKFQQQENLNKEQMIKLLRDMDINEDEINKYLSNNKN